MSNTSHWPQAIMRIGDASCPHGAVAARYCGTCVSVTAAEIEREKSLDVRARELDDREEQQNWRADALVEWEQDLILREDALERERKFLDRLLKH